MRIVFLLFVLSYGLVGSTVGKAQEKVFYPNLKAGVTAVAQEIEKSLPEKAQVRLSSFVEQFSKERWFVSEPIELYLRQVFSTSSKVQLLAKRGDLGLQQERGNEISGYQLDESQADYVISAKYQVSTEKKLVIVIEVKEVKSHSILFLRSIEVNRTGLNKLLIVDPQYQLTFEQRVKNELSGCPLGMGGQQSIALQNKYLIKTPLFENLFTDDGPCFRKIYLKRTQKKWHLSTQNNYLAIPQDDFERLFTQARGSSIALAASRSPIKAGDSFYFIANSKKDGFVSLIDVYENGQVAVIQSNRQVYANDRIQLPGLGMSLQAGLFEAGKTTVDLYIALWSPEKLELERYLQADESLVEGEQTFKFGELLKLMEKVDFSTTLVRTNP